jgi:hypothetical protein
MAAQSERDGVAQAADGAPIGSFFSGARGPAGWHAGCFMSARRNEATRNEPERIAAMTRNTHRLQTLLAAAATLSALAFGGCATAGAGARPGATDVRGKAVIDGAVTHAIAQGPARLLHVDVESGSGVSLYSVMIKADGSADCAAGARVGETARLHHHSNQLDLDLGPGQVACLTVEGAPRADVAWHVRQQPVVAGPELLASR